MSLRAESPGRALVVGFGGSQDRYFTPLLAWYRARGFDAELVIPSVAYAMVRPAHLALRAAALAARLAGARGRHVIHAFSNNGFITTSYVLDRLAARGASACIAALVLDSCPGFPPPGDARAVAHFFARGLGPMAGVPSDHWLTHGIEAALVPYFAARPGLTRAVAGSPARFISARPPVPTLLLHGGRDTVVPAGEAEAFAAGEKARGVPIERLFWPGEAHVTAWIRQRAAYESALAKHVDRSLAGAPMAVPA
jgi:alpha-beta hydrolase superfamily lysophospholipase